MPARHTSACLFLVTLLILLGGSLAEPRMAQAVGGVSIDEHPVPWPATRPRDPDVAPDGSIFLVGQAGDYVARYQPDTDAFRRWELPEGTGPHNLMVDQDGSIWFAGNRQGYIGHLNPADGSIERIEMPNPAAKDPHTLVPWGEHWIWFTVQWGNFIGRLDKRSHAVDLVPVPSDRARPYGITMDQTGRPWVVLLGTNKLATVDPETLQLEEIELPRGDARPRRIDWGPDGSLWYSDYAGGHLGRYDPASKLFREYPMPAGPGSQPYALALDGKGQPWLVETGPSPNRLVGFNPETGQFHHLVPIPSGGGAVRHMVYDAGRNALWFGTDTNNLGVAWLPD